MGVVVWVIWGGDMFFICLDLIGNLEEWFKEDFWRWFVVVCCVVGSIVLFLLMLIS